MKKKNKVYRAKAIPELSFQVWRNAEGTPVFTITGNPTERTYSPIVSINTSYWAEQIVKDPTVSFGELVWFCDLFEHVKCRMKGHM